MYIEVFLVGRFPKIFYFSWNMQNMLTSSRIKSDMIFNISSKTGVETGIKLKKAFLSQRFVGLCYRFLQEGGEGGIPTLLNWEKDMHCLQ